MKFLKYRGKENISNYFLRRKVNLIGHILRRNCLLHYANEGHMTELKGVEKEEN